MAKIHNPHPYDLFCAIKGDIIKAGDAVEATAEEAEKASRSGIFKVIDGAKREAGDVESAAKRVTAKRGSKTVETTAVDPQAETR